MKLIENKLKRIPIDPLVGYSGYRGYLWKRFDFYVREGNAAPIRSVEIEFDDAQRYRIQDCGMEKFIVLLSALLYEINHNDIDPDLVHEVAWDMADFETGEYDYLFTEKDLADLKRDVAFVKDYIWTNYEQVCREALKHRAEKQKKL